MKRQPVKFVQSWSEARAFNDRSAADYWVRKALSKGSTQEQRALSGVGYLGDGKFVAYIYGKGWVAK